MSLVRLLAVASYLSAVLPAFLYAGDRVKTENGALEATTPPGSAVRAFKGIPYAAPPIGDLRWREPQPVEDCGLLELFLSSASDYDVRAGRDAVSKWVNQPAIDRRNQSERDDCRSSCSPRTPDSAAAINDDV